MKMYRDIKAILRENVPPILMLGIGLPWMFKPLVTQLSESRLSDAASFSAIISLLIMLGYGIALYFLYRLLVHLLNYKKPTIEVTATGLRYPYFVKDDVEIPWENIQNIEHVVDASHKRTEYYMVIVLEKNAQIGELKHSPGLSTVNAMQKKYESKILLVFQNLVKGYNLSDLADRLNAERKSLTAPPQFINNEPVLYKKSERSLREIFKKLIVGSIAFLIVPSFFMLRNWDANARLFFIIFGVIVAFAVLKILYDHFFESFQPNVALCFNEQGISIVNDQTFTRSIAWKDIQHVELRTQKQSPILIIEAIDAESREVKSFEIKNDLKDTSVYEVISSLKYYL